MTISKQIYYEYEKKSSFFIITLYTNIFYFSYLDNTFCRSAQDEVKEMMAVGDNPNPLKSIFYLRQAGLKFFQDN